MFVTVYSKIRSYLRLFGHQCSDAYRVVKKHLTPTLVFVYEYLHDLADSTAEQLSDHDYSEQASFDRKHKDNLLSANNDGICIGTQQLPRKLGFESTLVVAMPGSGKTQSIVLYCMFKLKGVSKIINDGKKELIAYCGIYQAQGIPVYILDMYNPKDGNVRYNPVLVAMYKGVSGLRKLARRLVFHSPDIKKDFFNNQAYSIIGTMLIIITKVFKEEATLAIPVSYTHLTLPTKA